MKLYNTLTKKKEEFIPIQEKTVRMYHCGPTVYDFVHIGNLRSFMLGDFLRRTFEYLGYTTKQVMNVTDVGHLVSDGDEGEDKMTKALRREGKEITVSNMLELATFYIAAFKKDLSQLNILLPHHIPRASDYIKENIDLIKKLEEKDYTYITSSGVYFNTSKMPDYGKLCGLNLEKSSKSRIGGNTEKYNQSDFALWKFDDNQGWESPWGKGFPGWHIECSSMSEVFLGTHFDIHTGGIDNAPIHHNNEIAQSTCAHGTPFVNYWLHGEMLNFGGEKLSKSTGGNITLNSLSEKGIKPIAYRYLVLQSHYRSPMNFTWDIIKSAQNGLNRVYKEIVKLRILSGEKIGEVDKQFKKEFVKKIKDDINIPQALAVFHEMMKSNIPAANKLATAYNFDKVLGLGLQSYKEEATKIPHTIKQLLKERSLARKNKDWVLADSIRNKIEKNGYKVSDKNGKQIIEKK